VCVEQTVRSQEEKAAGQVKKVKSGAPKRKRGRPKGSKNKKKGEVSLSPELQHIQKLIQALLERISLMLHPSYLAMEGHFGNDPTF
jgi:putative transposase